VGTCACECKLKSHYSKLMIENERPPRFPTCTHPLRLCSVFGVRFYSFLCTNTPTHQCTHACTYVMHSCTYLCTHIHAHTCIYICMHVHLYVNLDACTHAHTHTLSLSFSLSPTRTHTLTRTHTCTHSLTHTRIHTHANLYAHMCILQTSNSFTSLELIPQWEPSTFQQIKAARQKRGNTLR